MRGRACIVSSYSAYSIALIGQTRRKAGTQSHRSKARRYDSGVAGEAQAFCCREEVDKEKQGGLRPVLDPIPDWSVIPIGAVVSMAPERSA